jgi:hypothetical protein
MFLQALSMYYFSFDISIDVVILDIMNPHCSLNVYVWIISALHTSGIV